VHELSIVCGIVTAVTESLAGRPVSRVYSVKLQVGALSGVVGDALQFSYGIATQGTLLEGSRLEVLHIPVVIHCDACHSESELPGVQSFRCPNCGTPSLDIRRGRELEIESMEVEEEETEQKKTKEDQ
jgi:hydrogenase nickel incorporation protein HypA/HybF